MALKHRPFLFREFPPLLVTRCTWLLLPAYYLSVSVTVVRQKNARNYLFQTINQKILWPEVKKTKSPLPVLATKYIKMKTREQQLFIQKPKNLVLILNILKKHTQSKKFWSRVKEK